MENVAKYENCNGIYHFTDFGDKTTDIVRKTFVTWSPFRQFEFFYAMPKFVANWGICYL